MVEESLPVFVVTDIETTGLIPEVDQILEIGAIALDANLSEVARFHVVCNYNPPSNWNGIHPIVANMHHVNGLWEECHLSKTSSREAGILFTDWLADTIGDVDWDVYLTGNSIEFDREFLTILRSNIPGFFHYRLVNISSFKILHEMWCEDKKSEPLPQNRKTHRSIPDCEDSVAELEFYREHFFPGFGDRPGRHNRMGSSA